MLNTGHILLKKSVLATLKFLHGAPTLFQVFTLIVPQSSHVIMEYFKISKLIFFTHHAVCIDQQ